MAKKKTATTTEAIDNEPIVIVDAPVEAVTPPTLQELTLREHQALRAEFMVIVGRMSAHASEGEKLRQEMSKLGGKINNL